MDNQANSRHKKCEFESHQEHIFYYCLWTVPYDHKNNDVSQLW